MTTESRIDDARYEQILRRDPSATGFYTAVRTTKIYCRPNCPARTPLRRNVSFFTDRAQAERAGYRPCKRCRPDAPIETGPLDAAIDAACRTIERAEREPTLAELAAAAGSSPFHFQRAFKKRVGLSPKAYALALRERRLAGNLRDARSVTAAALDAGFASASALYERSGIATGMTPKHHRAAGKGERIAYATTQTNLGWLLVARTVRGVCALELGDDRATLVTRLRERFAAATLDDDEAGLRGDLAAAVALVESRGAASDLPLDVRGTAFQQRVWNALREIPSGQTRTYAQIARAVHAPSAARAVANACAANVLAVAVPCHRVVREDGKIGGYRWGAARKRKLLERERGAGAPRSEESRDHAAPGNRNVV